MAGIEYHPEMPPNEWDEKPRYLTRWLIRRDMPEILQIEKDTYTLPWTDEDFQWVMQQRNCIGTVAEKYDKVLGFMLYMIHRKEIEIINFTVGKEYRRIGVGTALVNLLVRKCGPYVHRRECIHVNVRESNLPAQLFFSSIGFRAVEVMRGFYEDTREDGYRMEYKL